MGYTTEFDGQFKLDRPLTDAHREYLVAFADTRRMKRNAEIAAMLPDPKREAVGLPIGPDGAYFVGGSGFVGQNRDQSIQDYNYSPTGQPGLWAQWTPTADGSAIEWDGGEKFYNYVEWLAYLVAHFLQPWGYSLNGEVSWEGEEQGDVGKIVVVDNTITVRRPKKPTAWTEERIEVSRG